VRRNIFHRLGIGGIAVGLAIATMAVAGCGSSSTSTTGASGATGASGGTPLSQQDFVSQADAACKEGNDKIAALKAPTSSDLSSISSFAAQGLAIDNEIYAKLAAVTPPSDLQAKYSAYLNEAKTQIAAVSQLKDAADAGDSQKVQSIANQISSANDSLDSQAKQLGLTECAKNVQPQG
jgi:hypothetical protein